MAKKKARRPARAQRRAADVAASRRMPLQARSVALEDIPAAPGRLEFDADTGWRRFMPPSASDVLAAEQPVSELFGKIPRGEPIWTWWEDEDDTSTGDLVRDDHPHLRDDEVRELVAELDAETAQARAERKARFTALCEALGVPEPQGSFADLYQFCLQIGIAEERPVSGQPWVFPVPHARDVLDILPPGSPLAASERAYREHSALDRAWEADDERYGDASDTIIAELFGDGNSGAPVTTSIGRLARLLDAPEETARRAVAHLASPNPLFGRSHMSCTADPLAVPAHRVITLAVDWEAHDADKNLAPAPEQLAGVACIQCRADYREQPGRPQVTAGLAGADPRPDPLIACRGICSAECGSLAGTGQPVPSL